MDDKLTIELIQTFKTLNKNLIEEFSKKINKNEIHKLSYFFDLIIKYSKENVILKKEFFNGFDKKNISLINIILKEIF